jgi:hypothetical protein
MRRKGDDGKYSSKDSALLSLRLSRENLETIERTVKATGNRRTDIMRSALDLFSSLPLEEQKELLAQRQRA